MASLFTCVFVMMTIGHTLHVLCSNDFNDIPPRNLSCTKDKPYTDCDTKNERCICGKKCASHDVLFDGQCVDMCEGVYIHTFDYGVGDYTAVCVIFESVEFRVAGIGTLIVAYIVIMVAFFSSKSFSLSSMKNAIQCRKKRKTNNDDEDDDDNESDDDDLDHNVNCIVIIDDDGENHLSCISHL